MLRITGFPGLGRLNAITLGIHVVFYFLSLHIVKVYGIMFIHIMKYLHQQIAISINGPLSEIAPNYLFFSCIFSHWWHSAIYCPHGVHCNGSLCWLFSTTATLCHVSSALPFPVSLFPGTLCFYARFYVSSFITFSLSTVLFSTVLFFPQNTRDFIFRPGKQWHTIIEHFCGISVRFTFLKRMFWIFALEVKGNRKKQENISWKLQWGKTMVFAWRKETESME